MVPLCAAQCALLADKCRIHATVVAVVAVVAGVTHRWDGVCLALAGCDSEGLLGVAHHHQQWGVDAQGLCST